MWTSIDEKRPYIDGERIYIGVNDQGFAGCFNELHGVRNPQNNKHYWHCTYMTAEEAIPVLSGLKYWMPLPTVPSNGRGKPTAECGSA